jgi:hypothetical protein
MYQLSPYLIVASERFVVTMKLEVQQEFHRFTLVDNSPENQSLVIKSFLLK